MLHNLRRSRSKKNFMFFKKTLDFIRIACYNSIVIKRYTKTIQEVITMTTIYKANQEAIENGWDWDTIFANNAIEAVDEFETLEEAEEAFENDGYDPDIYGIF